MRSLERTAEAKALKVSRIRSPVIQTGWQDRPGTRMSMDDSRPSTSPAFNDQEFTSGVHGDAIGFTKEKKSRGMGSRIRGMLSSNALSSNLTSKSGIFKVPTSASSASLAQGSRMSLQLPPVSGAQGIGNEQGRLHKSSSRHSVQAVSGEGYSSQFQNLFPAHDPTIGTPLSPADSIFSSESQVLERPASAPIASMPLFRDLQTGTAQERMQQETQREIAGRKKEGLLWTPGVWEDVGASAANRVGEKRDKARWDSE